MLCRTISKLEVPQFITQQKFTELQTQINNLELMMEREQDVDGEIQVKEEIEDPFESLGEYDQKPVGDDDVDIKEEFIADNEDYEYYLKQVKNESSPDNEEDIDSRSSSEDDNQPKMDEANFSTSTKHIKKAHAAIRDYKCSICDKKFVQKSNLTKHMKIHAGIRDHKCSICDKKFVFKSNLNDHMKRHAGIKDYKCSVCDKKFVLKSTLTQHMKIHAGIRDFKCSICDKKFVQKSNLTQHMKIHAGIRNHKCSICDKKFVLNSTLTRHMNIHKKNIINVLFVIRSS